MSLSFDASCMSRALELARRGLYSTHPNPRVGCVIVADGRIVGEGWHEFAGEPHAEVHALRAAGELARGATAYVTLEPCSHFGRTPPCADGLIQAGVSRVVVAMQDPNPQVSGRGCARLQAAGIEVSIGVLEAEARALNPGFIKRMESGLPYVWVKLAMSLDGRTAMASGESQWITGPAARSEVQRLRARSSLVLTGADTVLLDQARLNVRESELGLEGDALIRALRRTPIRLLLDARGRVPLTAPFFQAGPAWVVRPDTLAPEAEQVYVDAGHRVLRCRTTDTGQLDLPQLLHQLGDEGINEIMVEAGGRLAGAFASQGLVDEYHLFIAAKFMGSAARPLLDWPLAQMADAPALQIEDVRHFGTDLRILARPA